MKTYEATEIAYKNGYEKGLLDGKGCCADCKSYWKTKLVNAPYRWIPVTERLPEKDGIYLTFNKKKQYEFHFFQTRKRMWPAIWDEDGVTHWMPLPAPPEENKEGAAYGESD